MVFGFRRKKSDKNPSQVEDFEGALPEVQSKTTASRNKARVSSGWLGRLRKGLTKTRDSLAGRLGAVLAGKSRLDSETIEELEEILYMADIGPVTVEATLDKFRRGEGGSGSAAERVQGILCSLLENPSKPPPPEPEAPAAGEPRVVLLIGVNGAGKTTTAGKLAARLSTEGQKVMFAAADTFRAAAGEQVEVWAERTGCHFVRHSEGADPGAVVYDAIASARARGVDTLLVDTAGRLHTRKNLMDELVKIRRVTEGQLPGAPHEILLVIDATSGQNALAQVREFGAALGVTGLVVTKLDGSANGGVLIGAVHESGIPARWIGVGEGTEDLLPFDAKAFAEALFGDESA